MANSKGVTLVTGSAQGIGRTIALRLASKGYDIGLNDIEANRDKLEALLQEIMKEHPERKACVLLADVSNEEHVKGMVEGAVKALGRLDVMVANAGIARANTFLDTTAEDWDNTLGVNARGTIFCYKYAAMEMIARGTKGRIIGASSVAGKRALALHSAYTASKFAVRGLTQAAAMEFGKYGITVNAYAPGAIETTMLDEYHEATIRLTGDKAGVYEPMKKLAPVGYLGKTQDVASLVSYLVSPEAHFITGQTISINGGTFFD